MTIPFTKMHGLGNDFMVIDAVTHPVRLTPEQITALSNRHTGVGFDQCLLIEPSQEDRIDFFYRIYNANGTLVGQCGNGARCIARFIQRYQLSDKKHLTIATSTTKMQLTLNDDETVTVNLGIPKLTPSAIPMLADREKNAYSLTLANGEVATIHAIQVGNPHAVLIVPDVTQARVDELGQLICHHNTFPEEANVSFLELASLSHIRLRVYERGCGETHACGSAAVAAAAVARLFHEAQSPIRVSLPGGDLIVKWETPDGDIYLTGPATFVYEGRLMGQI